jgi:predicted DNA-binding transcriptional regulator YafY
VIVDREAFERFRAELPSTPVSEETQPDGRVKVELLSFSIPWLAQWLLGFGLKVEALEPLELREALRDAAQAVVARYAEDFSMV